jgi:hypothetical protein
MSLLFSLSLYIFYLKKTYLLFQEITKQHLCIWQVHEILLSKWLNYYLYVEILN